MHGSTTPTIWARQPRAIVAAATLSAALVVAVPDGSVGAAGTVDEADIFFELNATAGDVGVHVSLDAERWKSLQITDPRGRDILRMEPQGSAAQIGLTELFFEGEEPSLNRVPFRRFLQLFPPGRYKFEGRPAEVTPCAARTG